jgi:hypothetical protein
MNLNIKEPQPSVTFSDAFCVADELVVQAAWMCWTKVIYVLGRTGGTLRVFIMLQDTI